MIVRMDRSVGLWWASATAREWRRRYLALLEEQDRERGPSLDGVDDATMVVFPLITRESAQRIKASMVAA